ncbi:MAG: hypothetical protein ACI86X_001713 [Moritella sp.]|jgi:hypothetical protein
MINASDHFMLIRPIAKRNGITLSLLASILVVVAVYGLLLEPNNRYFSYPLMAACLILGLVLLVVGITKLRDVYYRFSLTDEGIHYFTHHGGFTLLWQDIQRIDIPKISDGLALTELPYVGVRLKQREHLIDTASLPILAHTLIQQRALVLLMKPTSNMYENADNMLYPTTKVKHNYRGLQAMFFNRMLFLHNALGYDIYFPSDDLDRSPQQFVQLLRKYMRNNLERHSSSEP